MVNRKRAPTGRVHEKRFIVLHADGNTLTCVINSEISRLIACNPAMAKCQVLMDAARHAYMDHDSHIDCSRVRTYDTEEVLRQLLENPGWFLGMICAELRDDILGAIKHSILIPPASAGTCCGSLGAAVLESRDAVEPER